MNEKNPVTDIKKTQSDLAQTEPKYKHVVQKFVDKELGHYSWYSSVLTFENKSEGFEYWVLNIRSKSEMAEDQSVSFKTNGRGVFIRLAQDLWVKVSIKDPSVKYFWMVFLNWPR